MEELNVLQLAVLISRHYKYYVFVERHTPEEQRKDPLSLYVSVMPVQKLQDAKAIQALYGEKSFILRTITDYNTLFDIAQGIPGVKYVLLHPSAVSVLKSQKKVQMQN